MLINMPRKYDKYRWILNEFAKIKGIEHFYFDEGPHHLTLLMSNNMKGSYNKTYVLKLKERVFMEFEGIPDDFLDYDIMDLEYPDVFLQIPLIKAERFFSDKAEN